MRDSSKVKDLFHFRKCSQNKLVTTHLNINSLGNKFELLRKHKRNNKYSSSQFKINRFNNPAETREEAEL